VATDVAELETLAGSESTGDLQRAAKLYEGDLLEGLGVRDPGFEDWLSVERARLRDVTIGALSRLTAGLTGTEAVAMGQRLVELDPLREASHRALMRAYAGAGEKTLALQHYARCSNLLRAELGVAPARETEELRLRLLRESDSPSTVASVAVTAGPTAMNRISIAVMPFTNMSGDAKQEYFADGLTEDLITALSKSRHLHVIARNTTYNTRTGR
jgi:DNA-binding SARP family transcriptional activator